MRIAVCSDEPYPVHETVTQLLLAWGHELVPFGSIINAKEAPWALVAEEAAQAVSNGDCQEGIFFCWTGTGISMAANKVPGIRAALCSEPGVARAARIWNHANVICLSNRTLSDDMAKEILAAWFDAERGNDGASGVVHLGDVERRWRAPR